MNRKFVSKSNRILRKVLNSKENLDIIKNFIEVFLKIKIKEIKLNPYLESKLNYLPSEENFGIVDVRVKLEDDEELNIGIQFIDGYFIQNKMLLYYAQIHSNQLEYNDDRKVSKTITINLLDFIYLKSESYFSKITIPAKKNNKIELYVLELPKFQVKSLENLTEKDAWMFFLCGEQDEILSNIIFKEFSKIKKLNDLLETYWQNEIMT